MNTAASVRARLLNASKKSGEAFQSLLVRYAIERFLYRLGKSSHQNSFVLIGAMLFVAWGGRQHRPTKDLDLLGLGGYRSFKEKRRWRPEPNRWSGMACLRAPKAGLGWVWRIGSGNTWRRTSRNWG